MKKYIISPSILSADLARLGQEVEAVVEAGADWIHFDVMDNHYVPNLSFGPLLCRAIRNYGIKVPLDVHLMVKPVDSLITAFAEAGATFISFHPEASLHVDRSLALIHERGCQAGLAFNPGTPLNLLPYILDKLDLILIMSVNPGFAGQKFIPSSLAKIKEARKLIEQSSRKKEIRLAVDGGINLENLAEIRDNGADTFIAGSSIFNSKNHNNYKETIEAFRKVLV